ncbi:MAG TPA: alpha/beta fold hydrolase [Solimonas sp.]|nr:alpha/beta fold hydrolase [Solimonas sp.]
MKAGAVEVPDFRPGALIRHPQVQSILATKSPRRRRWLRRGSTMEALAQHHVLDCGDGVRLTGLHSPQPAGVAPRGLCVLIHGWEGSHDSAYLYSMACALHAAGYNVFRLNLRDHGGTHHLNKELFHSARMDEVLGAFRAILALDPVRPLFVVGFSLGGNFALRVAMQGPAIGIVPALTVGISPAIHPGHTLLAIDQGPGLIRWYFNDKWRRTLEAKKAAWPEYDFSPYSRLRSFVEITRRFVEEFTEYETLDNYLAQYTLTPEMIVGAAAPVAVITSRDDSVIPFHYFDGLSVRGAVKAWLPTGHGGHCGFIEDLKLRCWSEQRVLELFERL